MPSWGDILDWINDLKQDHGQQAYDQAINHYLSRLHDYTENDIIIYTTDFTQPSDSGYNQSITLGDMQGYMEVLSNLDDSELDLILHSPGGSPEAAEQIILYLRDHYDEIRIFVPQAAKSAATLMCCAADEIIMGSHSSLGPIDPQMQVQTQFGPRLAPAYAILNQFDQAREEFKQTGEVGAWGPILTQYGPSLLAECEDAIDLSEELARQWLQDYMLNQEAIEHDEHEEIARYLSNRDNFRSHGRPIPRSQVSDLGFNVTALEDDDELQDRVLSLHHTTSILMEDTRVSKIISNQLGDRYACFAPVEQSPETPQDQPDSPDDDQ